MPPRAGIARFALTFVALTLALGWLFSASSGSVGRYTLDASMMAVPAVAAMLAAQGFSWKRKLVYAVTTVCLYVLMGAAAGLTGLDTFSAAQLASGPSLLSAVPLALVVFLWTFPLVMLVLFVGRTPTRLWSKRPE